jgi:hypothetical protein
MSLIYDPEVREMLSLVCQAKIKETSKPMHHVYRRNLTLQDSTSRDRRKCHFCGQGVEVVAKADEVCKALMGKFIHDHPEVSNCIMVRGRPAHTW